MAVGRVGLAPEVGVPTAAVAVHDAAGQAEAEAITVIVSLSALMLGTVVALVWYLGGRIDRLDERLTCAVPER